MLSKEEALSIAVERGLDIVVVNPATDPPVAKIVDYGKFAYEQKKKEKKKRAGLKTQELKSIRIKFKTSRHDLETKARQIDKFLAKGNKVRVEMFLRGREKAHAGLARAGLVSFLEIITEPYRELDNIKKSPRGFNLTITKQ